MAKIRLSIIILNYNTKELLMRCLQSLPKNAEDEVIVVDNASTDGSGEYLQKFKIQNSKSCAGASFLRKAHKFKITIQNLKIIFSDKNLGFAGGNNLGAKEARGEYVLFLNPDTVVNKEAIEIPLRYLEGHSNTGAATVKVVLGSGKLDYSCHRGFPTPWNSLCYFSGLEKLFPASRLFAGYTIGHADFNRPHEVEAITGAFFMLPRDLGEKLGWFDTAFFWNGEDLDICYRIKESGYKIMYLPQAQMIHYKGSAGGHKKGSKTFYARFAVMKTFYDKHYRNKYPCWVRWLVYLGINLRMLIAYVRH